MDPSEITEKPIYSENGKAKWIGIALIVIMIGGGILGLTVFMWTALGAVLVAVACCFPFAGIVLSAGIYSRVELYQDRLQVGRATLPLDSLDPQFGVKRASDVLSREELLVAKDSIAFPGSGRRPPVVGGAYGHFLGTTMMAVRRSDGEILLFDSRRPKRLIEAADTVFKSRRILGQAETAPI